METAIQNDSGQFIFKCCENTNPNVDGYVILPIFSIKICSHCGQEHINFNKHIAKLFNFIYKFYLDKSKLDIIICKNKHLSDNQFNYIFSKIDPKHYSSFKNNRDVGKFKRIVFNLGFLIFGFASYLLSLINIVDYDKLEKNMSIHEI